MLVTHQTPLGSCCVSACCATLAGAAAPIRCSSGCFSPTARASSATASSRASTTASSFRLRSAAASRSRGCRSATLPASSDRLGAHRSPRGVHPLPVVRGHARRRGFPAAEQRRGRRPESGRADQRPRAGAGDCAAGAGNVWPNGRASTTATAKRTCARFCRSSTRLSPICAPRRVRARSSWRWLRRAPTVVLEPMATMPSPREQVDQVFRVAALTERPAERVALLQTALAAARRGGRGDTESRGGAAAEDRPSRDPSGGAISTSATPNCRGGWWAKRREAAERAQSRTTSSACSIGSRAKTPDSAAAGPKPCRRSARRSRRSSMPRDGCGCCATDGRSVVRSIATTSARWARRLSAAGEVAAGARGDPPPRRPDPRSARHAPGHAARRRRAARSHASARTTCARRTTCWSAPGGLPRTRSTAATPPPRRRRDRRLGGVVGGGRRAVAALARQQEIRELLEPPQAAVITPRATRLVRVPDLLGVPGSARRPCLRRNAPSMPATGSSSCPPARPPRTCFDRSNDGGWRGRPARSSCPTSSPRTS